MSTHTVYRLTSRTAGTGFDGLQACQEPLPSAGKHEVLVKIRSVALNFRDIAIAKGMFPLPVKDNIIPCSDMAGEIIQVGEGVQDFAIGDYVTAPVSLIVLYGPVKDEDNSLGGSVDGVLQQYITLPAYATIKLPKSSAHTFTEWAAMVTTAYTVWNAFYGSIPLRPGQTVLVLGTGGVSLTALIFAKAAGATTIITSSSDEKLEYIKTTYGADYTVNYKTHPHWAAEINRITNGGGVDQIIEVGGVGTIEQSLESVAWGGIVNVIGFLSSLADGASMPNVTFQTLAKGAILRGILAGSKQQLEEAVRFIAAQELSVPVDKTFSFTRDDIISAFKYVESGRHIGKVCINLE